MFNRNHRKINIHRPEDWNNYVPCQQEAGISLIQQVELLRDRTSDVLINIEDLNLFKDELLPIIYYWGHGYHQTLWGTEDGAEVHISNVYPRGKILFVTEDSVWSFDLPDRKVDPPPPLQFYRPDAEK